MQAGLVLFSQWECRDVIIMARTNNKEKAGFTFARLKGFENYDEWARCIMVASDVAALSNFVGDPEKNPRPALYQLASHEQDIAKLRYADSLQDQVECYDSRNRRTRGLILKMVVDYIQQELLALHPIQEWTPHGLWEHLKMRYSQRTLSANGQSLWICLG